MKSSYIFAIAFISALVGIGAFANAKFSSEIRLVAFTSDISVPAPVSAPSATIEVPETVIVGSVAKAAPSSAKLATRTLVCSAPETLVQDTAPGFVNNYAGTQTVKRCEYR